MRNVLGTMVVFVGLLLPAGGVFAASGDARVGEEAPSLSIDEVYRGKRYSKLERDQVYVVSFWKIDNLRDLEYGDRGMRGVDELSRLQRAFGRKVTVMCFVSKPDAWVNEWLEKVGEEAVFFNLYKDKSKKTVRRWAGPVSGYNTHYVYVVNRAGEVCYAGVLSGWGRHGGGDGEEDGGYENPVEQAVKDALGWEAEAEPLEVGQAALGLDVTWLKGPGVDPRTASKPVVLVFFSPDNYSERKAVPVLNALQMKFGERLEAVMVTKDSPDDIKRAIKEKPLFKVARDEKGDVVDRWLYMDRDGPYGYLLVGGKVVWHGDPCEEDGRRNVLDLKLDEIMAAGAAAPAEGDSADPGGGE